MSSGLIIMILFPCLYTFDAGNSYSRQYQLTKGSDSCIRHMCTGTTGIADSSTCVINLLITIISFVTDVAINLSIPTVPTD